MELKELGITPAKERQFNNKGIFSVEDLLRFLPRKYNDFTQITGLVPPPQISVIVAKVNRVNVRMQRQPYVITALCQEVGTNKNVSVSWFGQQYLRPQIEACLHSNVLICGKAEYNAQFNNYSIAAPEVFSMDINGARRIAPVYSKIQGMSSDYLLGKIAAALQTDAVREECVPAPIVAREGLMGMEQALRELHAPTSQIALDDAKKRLIFNDLLYFAEQQEIISRSVSKGSCYNIKTLKRFKEAVATLPYELTNDQKQALRDIIEVMRSGKRLRAFLYGDVGSGKSCVAFLSMIAMAENGYQAVLLAPTQVLALQHYENLCKMCEPLGFTPLLMNGIPTRKKEREIVMNSIASGSATLIVGTHALLNDTIRFKNLAFVCTDEEHRFGVEQRELLVKKTAFGVHNLSMSATPIPRTLAQLMYGEETLLCELKTMPAGRKQIKTAITGNMNAVFTFLKRELDNGRQAYIVCPTIEKGEVEDKASVEEIAKEYEKFGAPNGYKLECLTSKTPKDEMTQIIARFRSGETQMLVCTTILEVGVSVANASAIIIHNAECYGLATLHQLRGRVGRGGYQSYCVLFSTEKQNPRLQAMVQTTDGFEIARKDLELRGAGDFIGTKQSGDNKYLSLMLAYSDWYRHIAKIASRLVDDGTIIPCFG